MTNSVFKEKLDFIINCKTQIGIFGGEFAECKWGIKDFPRLLIYGGNFKHLNLGYWGGTDISELTIDAIGISGMIRVSGEKSKIRKIMLKNQAINLNLAFEYFSVNTLSIHQFRNDTSFRMVNICPLEGELSSEISIFESYLGKGEFYNVNFESFSEVNIYNAHLTDCSFVNIIWKEGIHAQKGRGIWKTDDEVALTNKISIIEKNKNTDATKIMTLLSDPQVIQYFQKLREVYRQLKYAFSKQGDIVNEQKFHSLEMKAHYKTLSWEKNTGTKAIILLSDKLSDFGQSISRPIIGLIVGHSFLLLLLIYFGGISNLELATCDATWSGFRQGFNWFIKLINPLRRGEELQGYYIALDITMRIWASYMIYNIIRASRRFIK
jgi:hypothetical protein